MLVVSDTSPILNLVAIERLELLRDLYGIVVIPPAVSTELRNNGVFAAAAWIHVRLGVLAEAKKRGLVASCAALLDEMIERAGFWIGDRLRSDYLKSLGETDEYPGCVSRGLGAGCIRIVSGDVLTDTQGWLRLPECIGPCPVQFLLIRLLRAPHPRQASLLHRETRFVKLVLI